MPHNNAEIKCRITQADRIRQILLQNGAEFKGTDHQIDTYFHASKGRLKLREGNIENALIYYERSDTFDAKLSQVQLYSSHDVPQLKAILTNACGVKVVVDKQREIYFIDDTKFHIDIVAGLGHFCEIEVIDTTAQIPVPQLQKQCQYYIQLLQLDPADMVATSYSDLLLQSLPQHP